MKYRVTALIISMVCINLFASQTDTQNSNSEKEKLIEKNTFYGSSGGYLPKDQTRKITIVRSGKNVASIRAHGSSATSNEEEQKIRTCLYTFFCCNGCVTAPNEH